MARTKKTKSIYASGVPPCPVTIQGAVPLSKEELLKEHNGLLIILAAILEQNRGRVLVSPQDIATVKKQKRVLQIIPGTVALSVQFDNYNQEEETVTVVEVEKDFLNSDAAKEAREFLAKQKEANDN